MDYYNKTLSWKFDLLEKLDQVAKEVEKDEVATHHPLINARSEKNLYTLKQKLKRDTATEIANKKKLDSECFGLNQKQRAAEAERKAAVAVVYTENTR